MGTVPTTPTFTAGEKLTAAELEQINDVVDFLSVPPQCMVYQSSAQTLSTATWTLITFTSEVYDVVQAGDTQSHDSATDPSRIYIRTPGKYEITGQITFSSNATGARQAEVWKNSNGDTTFATGTQQNTGKQGAVSGLGTSVPLIPVVLPFNAGDYVEAFAWQSSGGSLALLAGQGFTYLRIRWVAS